MMKALTLTQPWASLVALGAKRIETRSWSTSYRGPLAIHAAKSFPAKVHNLCYTEPFIRYLRAAGYVYHSGLPLGKVLATCRLVGCIQIEGGWQLREITEGVHWVVPPYEPELSFGDYTPGRWAWILGDITPLASPVPAKGALGLWEWTEQP